MTDVLITRDEYERLQQVVTEAQALLAYYGWLSNTARMINRTDISCGGLRKAVNAVGSITPREAEKHADAHNKRPRATANRRKRATA